jgi:hypothetical protein
MDLSTKFLNGLKEKYNMEFDDIKDWIYCGGSYNQHYNYFKVCYPKTDLPEYNELCICNTKIVHNCYIRPSIDAPVETILIVGSCCIEKFLPNGFTRFCERCSEVHKRTKYNICFDCEKKESSPYVYFDFSYSMKDEIKAAGAKWDDDNELWRVRRMYKPEFIEEYKKYIIYDIISFIEKRENAKLQKIEDKKLFSEGKYTTKFFTFADKDKAKSEGYQWDNEIKRWWKAIR